jgi:uncharacterized membrane protein (DUF373 family)
MTTTNVNGGDNKLSRIIKLFERAVVVSLVVMMMLVVALATVELGWIIVKDIITPPIVLLEVNELLEIFGFFLLILIGVELLETIKAYLKDNVIHVEIVIEVALVAVARKVIVLDLSEYDGLTVLSIAALIITLAGAFFLERRARRVKATVPSGQESRGAPSITKS